MKRSRMVNALILHSIAVGRIWCWVSLAPPCLVINLRSRLWMTTSLCACTLRSVSSRWSSGSHVLCFSRMMILNLLTRVHKVLSSPSNMVAVVCNTWYWTYQPMYIFTYLFIFFLITWPVMIEIIFSKTWESFRQTWLIYVPVPSYKPVSYTHLTLPTIYSV